MLKTFEMRWTVVKRGITTICRLILEMRLGYTICVTNFLNRNFVCVENTIGPQKSDGNKIPPSYYGCRDH